ncbi:hypothetical protein EYZ11_011332 [Aspergillus tanneri]|uniref:Uncharacterized protein n=1 Tax=Aspergillus tanneri TaxID=1220188 RepID=A0A4S3J340_9EURO|nr:hypothetical protein EYZ11_011332 [Aspergillus tanneri]
MYFKSLQTSYCN